MTDIADRLGSSLRVRLFVVTGGIVLVAVLAAVGFTALRSHQVAESWVRQALTSARDAQSRTHQQRLSRLRLVSRFVAGDPNFVAYVAEGDPASVRDLLVERQHELECDLAAVLDPRGRVVARTDTPAGVGEDLSRDPVVAAAMGGQLADGLWTDGQHYWTVMAEPLVSGHDLAVGVLVTGLALDDALAEDVHRQSRADVAYLALDRTPRIIASTIGDRDDLREALLRRAPRAPSPNGAPMRLDVGGHSWFVDVAPLRATTSGPPVAMATLASQDEALAPFMRIREALALVGLLSLIVAFALSYVLAGRVTRPVARLAAAADAARQGALDGAAFTALDEPSGPEEVRRLARAFRGLMRELRAERESQATLQSLWARLPDPEASRGEGPLKRGTVLGNRFEITSWIGAGGAGVVYRALDRELGEPIALKTLRPGAVDPASLEGLKAELRIARLITHPNVLRTHDFGEAEGLAFISMELVRGETVRVLIEHLGALPASMCVNLTRQMLSGLEAAHALGVLHRDIKPENLILDAAGRLRIMDFGIARLTRPGAAEGGLRGTLGYLAPEILRGETGDARADQYAVGVVMYEMLTARRPYTAASADELVYRILNETPPSPRTVNSAVPAALDAIVLRCLAADPAERYASVTVLAQALEAIE